MNLQVTAFHLDFSTLDMERGKADIIPSGISYTIQPIIIAPMIELEGILIDKDSLQPSGVPSNITGQKSGK
jgi:hypothetical protein